MFPDVKGLVPQKVDLAIRQLSSSAQNNQSRLAAIEQAGYITQAQARALYAAQPTSQELQANGSAPINVTNLQGRLAQPQLAYVPAVTSLPIFTDPLTQDGTLVSLNGVLYRYTASPTPGKWIAQSAQAVIIEDTHAHRLTNYPAANFPLNTLFFETDRRVFYSVNLVSTVHQWVFLMGTMVALLANRPTDLSSPLDDGFLFLSSDVNNSVLYEWISGGWFMFTPPPAFQVLDITLTAGANVIPNPTLTTNGLLYVFLTQPVGGGATITWGSLYVGVSTYIDPTSVTLSTFMFVFRAAKWTMVGQPTTGM